MNLIRGKISGNKIRSFDEVEPMSLEKSHSSICNIDDTAVLFLDTSVSKLIDANKGASVEHVDELAIEDVDLVIHKRQSFENRFPD